MLNRKHIRIKVMQALYAFESNPSKGNVTEGAIKNLIKDSDRLHDLYLYLMLFIKELAYLSLRLDDEVLNRIIKDQGAEDHVHKLWNDPLIQSIVNNKILENESKRRNILWSGDSDTLRKIYIEIKAMDSYQDLVHAKEGFNSLTFLTTILKKYTSDYDLLTSHFEDIFINWEDDRIPAYDIAIKTMKSLNSKNISIEGNNTPILFIEEMDGEVGMFAQNLLKLNIEKRETLQDILIPRLGKWEPSQIALLDYIIMRMAIAEFLYFETIPSQVTINEYVEISKHYSTVESKKLINGVLDFIYKDLNQMGKIKKIEFQKKVN